MTPHIFKSNVYTYTADWEGFLFIIKMLYSLQGSYGIFHLVLWRHTWWVKKKVWICVIYLMKVLYALNFTSCLFGKSKLYLIETRWLYALRGDDCRSSDSIPLLLLQYRWASGALQPQEFILDTSTNIKRCVNRTRAVCWDVELSGGRRMFFVILQRLLPYDVLS